MADLWKWNRPEEQGLQAPSFFLDPSTYVGGVGGLISKLAQRGAGKVLQHGAIVGTGKVAPLAKDLATADKIANLRRAVKEIKPPFLQGETYSSLAKGLNDLLEHAGWSYRIGP